MKLNRKILCYLFILVFASTIEFYYTSIPVNLSSGIIYIHSEIKMNEYLEPFFSDSNSLFLKNLIFIFILKIILNLCLMIFFMRYLSIKGIPHKILFLTFSRFFRPPPLQKI